MSVNASISTELRAKIVSGGTAVAIDQEVVKDGFRDFIFMFAGKGTAAKINEVDTVSGEDLQINLDRLVFNSKDIESGDVVLGKSANTFTVASGKIVFVGVYISAYHDALKPSVDGTLIARGYANPVGVWA